MIQVKICGLMTREDIDLCVEAGADMVGFVVDYPIPVPWNITREKANKLIAEVPASVRTCLVTGGAPDRILAIAEATRPDVIQLHYQETLAEIKAITEQLERLGIKTVKALRFDQNGKCDFEITDPVRAVCSLDETNISAVLVDSFSSSRPGGTGINFDLSVFKNVQQISAFPVILAGGLNPVNIQSVIKEVSPYAVDVLTGIESQPGCKDPEKVRRFINAVHSHNRIQNI
ncbi:MAG: phosphoribosylanthranilate isomerase [Syntrophomonas sp.]|nr:phosphoribosylanthranilate isomerase [Syntrophomonas sp.]